MFVSSSTSSKSNSEADELRKSASLEILFSILDPLTW